MFDNYGDSVADGFCYSLHCVVKMLTANKSLPMCDILVSYVVTTTNIFTCKLVYYHCKPQYIC